MTLIAYTLRRSDRRTLALEITRDGTLLVRAPRRMPESRISAFVASREAWIRTHQAKAAARLAAHPELTPTEKQFLREKAKTVFPERVAFFAPLVGVSPSGITVTDARTRFGSCSSRGRLSFSLRLLTYPPEAVDYVVVHELCHLLHLNHSPAFWAEVARVLPDYRDRRRLLSE